MYIITAIVLVVLIVLLLLWRWRRNLHFHALATKEEHLHEILSQIHSMKDELKQSETPEKQTLFRTTEEKMVMTYITSLRPNGKIVHSLSLSQERLPIRSAALISLLIVTYFDKRDAWNHTLKISVNDMKMVIYHFFVDMEPDEHRAHLNST
ncbi:MAG: hypothetical protein VX278_21320 [Myxococcota bacterium]|nr:hypothetical protein [Myxococcota bacterium]